VLLFTLFQAVIHQGHLQHLPLTCEPVVQHRSPLRHLLACCFTLFTGSDSPGAPAASPSDLLALCAATSVRRAAGHGEVTDSLQTAAAICGYRSPAALLPLLLQPAKLDASYARGGSKHAGAASKPTSAAATDSTTSEATGVASAAWGGVGRRHAAASLLQPAATLRERAAALMQVQGLSREDAAAVLRWSPSQQLHRDPKTTHLKLVLLQRQLLGWEPAHSSARTESVAPELTKMVKRCPWVSNLSSFIVVWSDTATAGLQVRLMAVVRQVRPPEA
jgi:hypothetical protein